jgi:hypothetical protein
MVGAQPRAKLLTSMWLGSREKEHIMENVAGDKTYPQKDHLHPSVTSSI